MSGRFARRKGERGIIIAVERCMNVLEDWRRDKKLVSRLKFEQPVRELGRAIPEEPQDSEFIDSLYQICLDLIERNGISFPKDKLKSRNQHACAVNRLSPLVGIKKDDTRAYEE